MFDLFVLVVGSVLVAGFVLNTALVLVSWFASELHAMFDRRGDD